MKKRAAIAAAIVLGAVTPVAVHAQTTPRDVPEICTRDPESLGEWLLRIAMCGVGPNR